MSDSGIAYMYAAYAVAAGAYLIYTISLVVRRRNVRRRSGTE